MAKKAKKVGKRMAIGSAADRGRGSAKPMRPGRGNEGMVPGKPDGSGVVGYRPPGGSVSPPDLSGAMPRPMPSPGPGRPMRNDKFLRPGTPKRPNPPVGPEVMPGIDGSSIGKPSIGRGDAFLGRPGVDEPAISKPSIGRPAPGLTRPGVDDAAPMPRGDVGGTISSAPSGVLSGSIGDMADMSVPMARGGMRGGGLARKGKGQALAKGGAVKPRGFGCAVRGMKKTKGK